jgi:DNA-binding transcriptional ArsR family regulator
MEEIIQKIEAFKAMGDPTRFRILQHLSRNDKLCVHKINYKVEN